MDEIEAFLERTEKEIDPGRMKKVLNALPGFLRVSCFDAHEAEVYFAPSVGASSNFVVCIAMALWFVYVAVALWFASQYCMAMAVSVEVGAGLYM